jgi:hypothetical protein
LDRAAAGGGKRIAERGRTEEKEKRDFPRTYAQI